MADISSSERAVLAASQCKDLAKYLRSNVTKFGGTMTPSKDASRTAKRMAERILELVNALDE